MANLLTRTFNAATNADWVETVDLTADGDTSWTLAGGDTVIAQMRFPPAPAELDVSPYITIVGSGQRTIKINVPSAQMSRICAQVYPFDILVNNGSSVIRRLAGTVIVGQGISAAS